MAVRHLRGAMPLADHLVLGVHERLPLAPEVLMLPGVDAPVLAATAALSLAWKLLWLATDMYPQGKDLYDAALLAEHTTVDRDLVRELMRPELGTEADDFTAETVLSWDVDWVNFAGRVPGHHRHIRAVAVAAGIRP